MNELALSASSETGCLRAQEVSRCTTPDHRPRLFVDVDADPGALPLIPASGCRGQINRGKASSVFGLFVLNLQWVWLSARSDLGSMEAGRRPQETGGEAEMPESIAETLACF